jgi:hypothetical protein
MEIGQIDIQQIVTSILALCGVIGVVTVAAEGLTKLTSPARKNAGRLTELERRSEEDCERFERIEKTQNAICKGTFALLCHAETGNNTGDIKDAREALQDFLIKR